MGTGGESQINSALAEQDASRAFRIMVGASPDFETRGSLGYANWAARFGKGEGVLLSYWGKDRVFVATIESDKALGVSSISMRELMAAVSACQVVQQKATASKAAVQAASDKLFATLKLETSQLKRLIILGNNPLSNISWSGLLDSEGAWLGENVLVRLAPSIYHAFPKKKKYPPGYLIYGMMPGTSRQKAISAVHEQFGGRLEEGRKGSWKNFKQFAPLANLIHLEQHCLFLGDTIVSNSIFFSDTILHVDSIAQCSLFAQVAVANGICSGEAVQSFGEAFAEAGCPSLVGSLWEVEGSSNELILSRCYLNIKQGMSINRALQKAQMAYLDTASAQRSQPYYWAGLALSGASGKTEKTGLGWFFLAALCIILLLLWTNKRTVNCER
jgi:hypothetical protein